MRANGGEEVDRSGQNGSSPWGTGETLQSCDVASRRPGRARSLGSLPSTQRFDPKVGRPGSQRRVVKRDAPLKRPTEPLTKIKNAFTV